MKTKIYSLPKHIVDVILTQYPEKTEQWVQEQYTRCYNNVDHTGSPYDENIMHQIMIHEFALIKEPTEEDIADSYEDRLIGRI